MILQFNTKKKKKTEILFTGAKDVVNLNDAMMLAKNIYTENPKWTPNQIHSKVCELLNNKIACAPSFA